MSHGTVYMINMFCILSSAYDKLKVKAVGIFLHDNTVKLYLFFNTHVCLYHYF